MIHDPGGVGFKIESIYAYLAVHADGDEGVVGVPVAGTFVPAIAADRARLDQLRPVVQRLKTLRAFEEGGKEIVLVQFTQRIDLETM
jgi:hypothetical protein